jgi:hypothetical protein
MRPFIYLAVIISLVAGQANLNTLPLCAIVCVGAGINGTGCAATNVISLTPDPCNPKCLMYGIVDPLFLFINIVTGDRGPMHCTELQPCRSE